MNTNLTTAQLLDQLNTFRTRNGKSPLKSWKASRAALETALNAEVRPAPFTPATQAELDAQQPRATVIAERTHSDNMDTSGVPTSPVRTAELAAARKENDRKDAALAALEAEQPSPSANIATRKKQQDAAVASAKKADRKVKKLTPKALGFSAAKVIAEFNIPAKVGRALLRKNKIAKTPEAIRAFFKSRAK